MWFVSCFSVSEIRLETSLWLQLFDLYSFPRTVTVRKTGRAFGAHRSGHPPERRCSQRLSSHWLCGMGLLPQVCAHTRSDFASLPIQFPKIIMSCFNLHLLLIQCEYCCVCLSLWILNISWIAFLCFKLLWPNFLVDQCSFWFLISNVLLFFLRSLITFFYI